MTEYKATNAAQTIHLSVDGCENWCENTVPVYTYYCDSIILLDNDPEQELLSPYKTKTIAKHSYPWYHQRSFR